jgi:ketosteroid isomerase-like protein
MVQAELAFSEAARAKGMKDAFIEFAAPDGLMFRRGAVNARELWRRTDPAPTGRLSWHPTYADVARSGELGYTTGPWEFRPDPSDEKASGHGHFVTLWRMQADGSWLFALDIGVNHAAPAEPDSVLKYPASAKDEGYLKTLRGGRGSERTADAARVSILAAENGLATDANAQGAGAALLARAAEDIRVYRQNALPFVGLEAARPALEKEAERRFTIAEGVGAAESGELGYAYGTYLSGSERGSYLRIWKRTSGNWRRRSEGEWRVVLDITNPSPPPRKSGS